MAKTYFQKMNELRLKSLEIIEHGLNHESEYVQFSNAVQFMAFQTYDAINSEMPEEPDALDATEIIEKDSET